MTLREARRQSGLKTSYICYVMGFTSSMLYLLEQGKYPVSDRFRKAFAELYGLSVADIQFLKTS